MTRSEALLAVLAESQRRGFLGPGPVQEHLDHSRAFVPLLAGVTGPVADLGSGGGVPGLVLAVELPHLAWRLVDGMVRRTSFLAEAVDELGLGDRVSVHTARAELLGRDPAWRGHLGAAVARAFGPPAVTAECAAPLLRVGGRLVVSEPPGGDPMRWPPDCLAALGLGPAEVVAGPPAFARLEQRAAAPDSVPRRAPGKRPLW